MTDTYTVDANAALVSMVEALPPAAGELFRRADDGEVALELPTVAAAETVYKAEKGVTVRGQTVRADGQEVAGVLMRGSTVSVVPDDKEMLAHVAELLEEFPSQIHDAVIVASHRARDTEAIVTADGVMADTAETVWR